MLKGNGATRALVMTAFMGLAGAGDAQAQGVHPGKQVFASAEEWPAIAPGESPLEGFRPFRAVYVRNYLNGAGEERDDRIIITAERVAWYGTRAIMVTLIDTGNVGYDDTSPRVHVRTFAVDDQRMLHQVSPVPGTPHDLFVVNTSGDSLRVTHVADATGEGEVRTLPAPLPQLGAPALWLVAAMPLEEGATIRFASADLPAASSTLHARPFRVAGRAAIDAGPLGTMDALVVDYPLGMTGARIMHNWVVDRPPYILGKRSRDLDTGELSATWSLRLIEYAEFEDR